MAKNFKERLPMLLNNSVIVPTASKYLSEVLEAEKKGKNISCCHWDLNLYLLGDRPLTLPLDHRALM